MHPFGLCRYWYDTDNLEPRRETSGFQRKRGPGAWPHAAGNKLFQGSLFRKSTAGIIAVAGLALGHFPVVALFSASNSVCR